LRELWAAKTMVPNVENDKITIKVKKVEYIPTPGTIP
jgi:hypothetical protein